MDRDGRQVQIFAWAKMAFTAEQATSLPQRGLRLLEEAIEAFQATCGDKHQAHELVDYVFSRPAGVLHQELGGVGVTLLVLAAAAGLSADEEEAREVARVLSKPVEMFTARNAAKNEAGFLAPQLVAATGDHAGAWPRARRVWREGVSFPVELEEDEASVIEATIREKFYGPAGAPPPAADRLCDKMRHLLKKFHDKRVADEEFAASLTDEERQVIRARRAGMGTDRKGS